MLDFKLKERTNGEYSFRLSQTHPPKLPYYSPYFTILWAEKAHGICDLDAVKYDLEGDCYVFFLSPCQPYCFDLQSVAKFITIELNATFFCLEHHSADIGCNGVLFNNALDLPFLELDDTNFEELVPSIANIEKELRMPNLAQRDILLAYLKVFMVFATRIHKLKNGGIADENTPSEKIILMKLRILIEEKYRTTWQSVDYANALNMGNSTLAATLRRLNKKTISQMVQDRILIQAKRELVYNPEKTVNEIAYDLGFNEPSYFIRLFKKHTNITPNEFRKSQFDMYR